MNKRQNSALWFVSIAIVLMAALVITSYNTGHKILAVLTVAGIISGLVNYYYVFLNLPLEKKNNPAILSAEDAETPWSMPLKSYWLALSGYLLIGIAGSYLTPLINSILGLKGAPSTGQDWSNWILLGYGIVFGFGTNRMLDNLLGSILKRLSSLENKVAVGHEKFMAQSDESSGPWDPFTHPVLAPTDSGSINGARFGCTRVDDDGTKKWHGGVDLLAAVGTSFTPIYGGVVQTTRADVPNDHYTEGVGNFVIIKTTEKGISIKYCHLSKVSVRQGATVGQTTILGETGKSGNAYNVKNPHMHVEVSTDYFATNKNYVDPEPYMATSYGANPFPPACS